MDTKESINGPRLDRIEDKIDKLSDAMVSLARSEEKIQSLETDRQLTVDRLNGHSNRLNSLENQVDDNNATVKAINRVFWIAVTAFTATIFGRLIFGIELFKGFV